MSESRTGKIATQPGATDSAAPYQHDRRRQPDEDFGVFRGLLSVIGIYLLIGAVALLFSFSAKADGFLYVELGVARHFENIDCPEFCNIGQTLGSAEIGYTFNAPHDYAFIPKAATLYCEHISGLFTKENGRGLNMCGGKLQWRFGE